MDLLKFWDLVWWFYKSSKKTDTMVVVALWAPGLFDIDNLRESDILLDAWYDIIVPEYYWFCRSSWIFTPKNCVKTLLDTKENFTNGEQLDIYSWEKYKNNYNNFIFIGFSFGWAVVWCLPKFDSEIKSIAMIYPVLDYSTLWKKWVKEETAKDFIDVINRWFWNIYRGYDLSVWHEQFNDKLWLTPSENISYMKDVNLFISHGYEDESLYYKRTKEYYEKLKGLFPKWNYLYKEYKWSWHDIITMKKSIIDLINFIKN